MKIYMYTAGGVHTPNSEIKFLPLITHLSFRVVLVCVQSEVEEDVRVLYQLADVRSDGAPPTHHQSDQPTR